MNQYTELLSYFKSLCENDVFINTFTQGDTSDYDLDKGNIFPVCNIDILSANFPNPQTISFSVEIACMQIRDINKTLDEDKFWLQDNKVDNLNETLASLNRMWLIMYKDFEDRNISAELTTSIEEVTEWNKNLVDGWLMSVDIIMPNTTVNLCQ
jgi:hypothetical protein